MKGEIAEQKAKTHPTSYAPANFIIADATDGDRQMHIRYDPQRLTAALCGLPARLGIRLS